MKVTLRHIAQKSGVSVNTVSMALRNMPGIKEETRLKILENAEQLGYFSSKPAKSPKNICLISTGERLRDSYFYMSFLQSILKKTNEYGANMMIYSSANCNMSVSALGAMFESNDICGIIVLGDTEEEIIANVAQCGLPIVATGTRYHSLNICTVIEDNYAGTYMAVRALLDKGRKNIGFMGKPMNSTGFMERYVSTIGVLNELDLPYREKHFITDMCFDDQYDFIKVANRIKDISPFPDAFICANDNVGIILLKSLDYLGKSVPEEISVIGFDNSAMGKMSNPSLSSVDVMHSKQSEICVNTLLNFISTGTYDPQRILVPVTLVGGDSV